MSAGEHRILQEQISELDFPVAQTPSIGASRVHDPAAHIAVFADDYWPLDALDNDVTRTRRALSFSDWPAGFKDFAKHVAFALINHGTPSSLLEQANLAYVQWPSQGSINKILGNLRRTALWLVGPWSAENPDTPVMRPADLDSHHLDDVRRWIDSSGQSAKGRNDKLEAIVRVWHLNPMLPPEQRFPSPRWEDDDWKARRRVSENRTKPISQSTMGPLLEWAIAFVTVFADDIITAQSHYLQRLSEIPPERGSSRACKALLEQLAEQGATLTLGPPTGRGIHDHRVGWTAVAYSYGLPAMRLADAYRRLPNPQRIVVAPDKGGTAIAVPVTAEFHGKKWIPYVGVYDVHPTAGRGKSQPGLLMVHLRTACMIVASYLTGARPEEILGLEHGAAPDPILSAGGSRLHLIHGRVWKGVSRNDGGAPGEPLPAVWATIEPATRSIRVAETINRLYGRTGGLLFTSSGRAVDTGNAAKWIQEFMDFVNTRLVPHTVNPEAFAIPADPAGPVSMRRFRRTLAWFMRNRPDGDVTVAIQYQQLDEVVAGGYGGTKESGLNQLLSEEDWAHRRTAMRKLGELLAAGQGISGPAADRAVQAAQALPRHLSIADERRLRKDPSTVVYDNPAALNLCLYRESTASCAKLRNGDGPSRPDLVNCVHGCVNGACTDDHLDGMRDEALQLRREAALSPQPLALSLLAEADRREAHAESLSRTRLTLSPTVRKATPNDGRYGQ